jgi:hypothetical protein
MTQKNRKLNILAYALKSDDGAKTEHAETRNDFLKIGNWEVNTSRMNDPQNLLWLVLKNATSTCNEKPSAVEVSFLKHAPTFHISFNTPLICRQPFN